MAAIVYILCALTSLICAILLLGAYSKNKFRLLFWCGIGFVGFTINNSLLFVDLIIFPKGDLLVERTLPAFIGMVLMIYGLIVEEV